MGRVSLEASLRTGLNSRPSTEHHAETLCSIVAVGHSLHWRRGVSGQHGQLVSFASRVRDPFSLSHLDNVLYRHMLCMNSKFVSSSFSRFLNEFEMNIELRKK